MEIERETDRHTLITQYSAPIQNLSSRKRSQQHWSPVFMIYYLEGRRRNGIHQATVSVGQRRRVALVIGMHRPTVTVLAGDLGSFVSTTSHWATR